MSRAEQGIRGDRPPPERVARAGGGEQTDACAIGIILGNAMARR
jgi:hypothetical protein